MGALKNEERLRRFYLDLGGSDPEKITAESSEAEIILAVILEIAGDEARIERFGGASERAKPITEELVDYGRTIGDRLLGGLRSFVRPFCEADQHPLYLYTGRLMPRKILPDGSATIALKMMLPWPAYSSAKC